MNSHNDTVKETRHLDRALDVTIRLTFVGLIVVWCSKIIRPFFMLLAWGLIIAVALYPVFLKLKGWRKGRNSLAGVLFILASLALVLTPTLLLTDSIIQGATGLGKGLEEGTLSIPPPSEKVKEWPAIGEKVYASWSQMSSHLGGNISKYPDQLKSLAGWMAGSVAAFGGAMVQTIFALIIAGVLMMNAGAGERVAYAFAWRLGGEKGEEYVNIS